MNSEDADITPPPFFSFLKLAQHSRQRQAVPVAKATKWNPVEKKRRVVVTEPLHFPALEVCDWPVVLRRHF